MMLCGGSTMVASLPVKALPDAAPGAAALCSGAGAARGAPPPLPPADWLLLPAVPEQAVTRRPVPTEAAPAMRSVRAAPWRARAPMARNERLMYLRRSGQPAGFVMGEMASWRYRCVAWTAPDARMSP